MEAFPKHCRSRACQTQASIISRTEHPWRLQEYWHRLHLAIHEISTNAIDVMLLQGAILSWKWVGLGVTHFSYRVFQRGVSKGWFCSSKCWFIKYRYQLFRWSIGVTMQSECTRHHGARVLGDYRCVDERVISRDETLYKELERLWGRGFRGMLRYLAYILSIYGIDVLSFCYFLSNPGDLWWSWIICSGVAW